MKTNYSRRELYALGEPLGNSATYKKATGGYVLGGGGGGSPPPPASPTSTTVANTNIPDYLRPYAETMLGATMQQLFNTQQVGGTAATPAGNYDASGNPVQGGGYDANGNPQPGTPASGGTTEITGVKPYVPYSTNPSDYVAGFSPLQNQAFGSVANMQVPGQYGQASNMAGQAGQGALGTVGQADMYGQQGANLSNMYGQAGAQAGQQAAGQSSMYGGLGALQGQQGAAIGQSLGQMSTSPGAVGAYMNPYIQNALAPAQQLLNQQYGMQGATEQGAATSAGAFGGSREALMSGLNQQNQMLAQNQLVGNAYQNAYQNAQQQMNAANQAALSGNAQALSGYGMGLQGAGQAGSQAMQGLGMGLSGAGQAANIGLQGIGAQQAGYGLANNAATNLANIGTQQLGAQQGIAQAQMQAGTAQQQQQQNIINQAIQNYATAQQYPEQQLSFMNSMLRGLPTQQMTTQGYQAPPSSLSQVTGLGLAGLGAYQAFGGAGGSSGSDAGLKENIIGLWTAPNGLRVYEFEYKPEFKDHPLCGHGKFIGYMAQEVEKVMPEAVFTMDNGFKAVNYDMVGRAA